MLRKICEIMNYNYNDVISRRREVEVVNQRIFIAYFLRRFNYSLNQIGVLMNRDHSTIICLLRKGEPKGVQELYEKYKNLPDFQCNKVNKAAVVNSLAYMDLPHKEIKEKYGAEIAKKVKEKLETKPYIQIRYCKFKKVPNYKEYKTDYEEETISKKIRFLHKDGSGLLNIDDVDKYEAQSNPK